MKFAQARPVAPDSVHVWRGFRSESNSPEQFADFLGAVFLPACALLQPNAGLHAYIPSLPKRDGKPDTVPDQSALMFWTTQQTYQDAFKTVAVRAYTHLHGDAYNTKLSKSGFPVFLEDSVQAGQPYYLVDQPADWMLGDVHHLVGGRPDRHDVDDFLGLIYEWAAALRDSPPDGLEAGLLAAAEEYVVAWLLWNPDATDTGPLAALAAEVDVYLNTIADRYVLPAGLWDDWPGIELGYPNSINIQLDRP